MVHDIDPAVFGGEYKQRHQSLDNTGMQTKNTFILTSPRQLHTFLLCTVKHVSAGTARGTHLSQVVKVVLMVDPFIVGLQTVRLVGDVFDIRTQAVEEFAFKELSVQGQRNQDLQLCTYI